MTFDNVGAGHAASANGVYVVIAGAWLAQMTSRPGSTVFQPTRLVTVAMANKTARIVWALQVRGEAYRSAAA